MISPSLIIGGVALAAGLAAGGYGVKVYKDNEILTLKTEHAVAIAAQEKARADLSEEYRIKERALGKYVDQIIANHAKEMKRVEELNADLTARLERLRNKPPIAIPPRPTTDDPLAACNRESAVLGILFNESVELHKLGGEVLGEIGDDAERHAQEVRTLKEYADTVYKITNAPTPSP